MSEHNEDRLHLGEELRAARDELLRLRRLGNARRVPESEHIDFADIFDLEEIQQVQDAFARATGVASIITDPSGVPLTRPSNFCRLCSEVVRTTEEGLSRCMRSDAHFGRKGHDGPVVSHCLSVGLLEGGAPITVGEQHLASWLVGQVRDADRPELCNPDFATTIGADRQVFAEALSETPLMSREHFTSICDALYLFARLMSRQALFNLRQAREIRRRRKMLSQLKRSRRMADSLLNATPDAAFLVDLDGTIIAANTPAALRYDYPSPEQMHGVNIRSLMDWEQFELSVHQLQDCMCSGVHMEVEDVSGERVFHNYLTPVYDESGRGAAVSVFSREITEERRLQRLRDDVERIARHDIKSPLTGIIGLARLLSNQPNLSERQQELAETIADAASGTLHKLNTQFDLFRMEEGTYHLRAESFDLAATLRRIVRVLGSMARSRKLTLDVAINGEPMGEEDRAMLYGEEFHVEGMLQNLLQNALEASPKGGEVYVDVDMGLSGCVIAIHNQGVIPPDMRGRFFEKYATSGKAGGTGLGTYSARLIARAHQGDISYATHSQEGTTVTVTLPQPGGEQVE